jgi:hypothetical protein
MESVTENVSHGFNEVSASMKHGALVIIEVKLHGTEEDMD